MLLRLIAVLAILLFFHARVGAQEAVTTEPIIGSSAGETTAPATGATEVDSGVEILVIGDALGGGLGAGLSRRADLEGGIHVTPRFTEESGIARPEVYDWSASLPKILEGKSYDAAVVLLGANDRQPIRVDGLRHDFNSPEWITAYKVQTDKILDALTAAGTKIYWVSIPPMADPEYDAAMVAIVKIQKERVESKGGTFVDIRPAFLGADGRYSDVGADDTGEIRKLRSRDGVTFFKQGNNRMGQLVLEAIKAGGTAKPVAPIGQGEETQVADEPATPLFGQAGVDGVEVSFRPADPGVAGLRGIIATGETEAGLSALQSLSPPGSSAEKLFVSGEALPAPTGRADDFSVAK